MGSRRTVALLRTPTRRSDETELSIWGLTLLLISCQVLFVCANLAENPTNQPNQPSLARIIQISQLGHQRPLQRSKKYLLWCWYWVCWKVFRAFDVFSLVSSKFIFTFHIWWLRFPSWDSQPNQWKCVIQWNFGPKCSKVQKVRARLGRHIVVQKVLTNPTTRIPNSPTILQQPCKLAARGGCCFGSVAKMLSQRLYIGTNHPGIMIMTMCVKPRNSWSISVMRGLHGLCGRRRAKNETPGWLMINYADDDELVRATPIS